MLSHPSRREGSEVSVRGNIKLGRLWPNTGFELAYELVDETVQQLLEMNAVKVTESLWTQVEYPCHMYFVPLETDVIYLQVQPKCHGFLWAAGRPHTSNCWLPHRDQMERRSHNSKSESHTKSSSHSHALTRAKKGVTSNLFHPAFLLCCKPVNKQGLYTILLDL